MMAYEMSESAQDNFSTFIHQSQTETKTLIKRCSGYGTKLQLMVRLQFWNSEECGVPLLCHYSQVHSDLKWFNLLKSHQNRSV